ncbi:hypothetical protein [Streptomyces sp. NPDC054863]
MAQWIVMIRPVEGVAAEGAGMELFGPFQGSPEEASRIFADKVNSYTGELRKVGRREIYKHSDRSYLVRVRGSLSQYSYLFELAERVADAEPPSVPGAIA